jgi:CO/xanthine dehydrogenase Mo-binding subunit
VRALGRFQPLEKYEGYVCTVTTVVVRRQEEKSSGGGEELIGPAAAAIANAFFDPTGVRLREYPRSRYA